MATSHIISTESIADAITSNRDDIVSYATPDEVPTELMNTVDEMLSEFQTEVLSEELNDTVEVANEGHINILSLTPQRLIVENSYEFYDVVLSRLGYTDTTLHKIAMSAHENEAALHGHETPPNVHPVVLSLDVQPDSVIIPQGDFNAIVSCVETIRENRGDDPEAASYALDDLENTLNNFS
jgi:predicted house-cleaning noncanonical NTP pyrophosphatase (MazG superfamily)